MACSKKVTLSKKIHILFFIFLFLLQDNSYYCLVLKLQVSKLKIAIEIINYQCGRKSRVSEPESEAGRLRNHETPCRYIIARVNESIYFFITLGTLLKSLFTNILYFKLWEPGAVSKSTAPKP